MAEIKTIVKEDYAFLKWSNPCHKINEELQKRVDLSKDEGDTMSSESIFFHIEKPNQGDLQEVINSIFPPREWEENGLTWIQHVSTEESSRQEILELSRRLEDSLRTSGAIEKGYCEIRRNIYTQLFDELIRLISVTSLERGLLLLRVRDDTRMTIDTLKNLANSVVTLGKQKAIQAEEGVPELLEEIEKLKAEKAKKEIQLHHLEKKHAIRERAFKDWKDREVAKHKRKIDFLKATNEGIQTQWDLITAWKPQNIEMEKYLFEEDA